MAPAIPIIIAVAGAFAQTLQEATSGSAESKAQAQGFENEAKIAEQNARSSYAEGSFAEELTRKQGRAQISSSRAMLAQSGIVGGAATTALAQSEADLELDALNARYQFQTEGNNFMNESKLKKAYAKYSLDLGKANASNSWKSFFLIGAPMAAGNAYANSKTGAGASSSSSRAADGLKRNTGLWIWNSLSAWKTLNK